ncbi:hypothetical protein LCGC14_1020760 [marine sediment metagenome]|uniref:Uncharacterized protein n=1 Tax=marine sediment metagenome TaxID=412755 RepID=A0A0F9R3E3_9ZZZZ
MIKSINTDIEGELTIEKIKTLYDACMECIFDAIDKLDDRIAA